ncbi:unnamed protein product, partial [Polarella glacialis]
DHTLQVWDLQAQLLVHVLRGHKYWVNDVAYSMDGAWIASASADKTVKVWRAADGRCLATLSGHLLSVSSVAFSSDARRIASGSWDKTVCIWDVEQGRAVLTLTGHADWVHSVAWAPGSHQVASASSDHSVRVWSTISGVVEQVLVGHLQTVSSVSFARSGVFLASGSLDGTVRVWNLQEGTLAARLEQDSSVHSVAFSPDSEHIVVGCRESLVKVWSFRNGEQEAQLSGHEESVQCVATSLDGSVAASCSHDKTLRVWRLPKRQTQKVSAMQRTPLGGLRQVISPEPSLQELQEQLKRSDEVNQHLRKQLLQAQAQSAENGQLLEFSDNAVGDEIGRFEPPARPPSAGGDRVRAPSPMLPARPCHIGNLPTAMAGGGRATDLARVPYLHMSQPAGGASSVLMSQSVLEDHTSLRSHSPMMQGMAWPTWENSGCHGLQRPAQVVEPCTAGAVRRSFSPQPLHRQQMDSADRLNYVARSFPQAWPRMPGGYR